PHPRPLLHRPLHAKPAKADMVEDTAVVVGAAKAVRAADAAKVDQAEVPAARAAASASIFARRRCASSASRRWTSSTTSAQTSFRNSCRSAGRFFRGV